MKLTTDLRLQVSGIMGLADLDAEVVHGAATEVVGRNAAGKTSAATALMACAAVEPNPRSVTAASIRKAYVRDGVEASDAEAVLTTDDARYAWRPGSGTVTGPQSGAISSAAAVGLVSFTDRRPAKERAATLQEVLLPSEQEVEARIEAAVVEILGEHDARGAMNELRARGWAAAEAIYRDRAKAAKREWSTIANRAYGVRVADDWRPDGWLADLDGMTVQEAEAAKTAARDALASLHVVTAVSAERRAQVEQAVSELPAGKKRLAEAEHAEHEAEERLDMVREHQKEKEKERHALASRAAALQRLDHSPQHCPHCTGAVVVDAQGIVCAAREPSSEERSELVTITARINELAGEIMSGMDKAQDELREATREAQAIRGHVNQLTMLAEEANAPETTDADAQAVADAEAAVDRAKEQELMVRAVVAANDAHATAVRYGAAATALGPRGPRGAMIEKGLSRMVAGMAVIADVAGWPVVSVNAQGQVTVGERPVELCSESEQWRAQAAMQLTVAALDGSGLVVLDRADLLDDDGRRGLSAALDRVCAKTGITVVVCATGAPTFDAERVIEVGA